VADLEGTLRRFTAAGVAAAPMAGKVRLTTHADLGDADIAAALQRIGAADGGLRTGAGAASGHPAPGRPAGR